MKILNHLAKEQQERDRQNKQNEKPMYLLTTPLWQNVRKYLPNERVDEVYIQLRELFIEDYLVNWEVDNLDKAMCWDDMPQGYDYWSSIHHLCIERGILHDGVDVIVEVEDEDD
jgi:hypothetical protein